VLVTETVGVKVTVGVGVGVLVFVGLGVGVEVNPGVIVGVGLAFIDKVMLELQVHFSRQSHPEDIYTYDAFSSTFR
jgi:hypothetical protein